MNELSLFTGYGGFSLGLRLAGVDTKTVCYVEIDKYCQAVLEARIADGILDEAPIWGDIKTFDGNPWRGQIDIITGGFPCPPFSIAGLRKGVEDERNLWPETLRVVREVRPRILFLENVANIVSGDVGRGFPSYASVIVGQLAQEGYRVRWEVLGADDIGAPHRRKRWWCIGVADSGYEGLEGGIRNPGGEERQTSEEIGYNRDRVRSEAGCGDGTLADSEDSDDSPYTNQRGRIPQQLRGSSSNDGQLADSDSQRGRSGITYWEDAEDVGQPPEAQSYHGAIPVWPPSSNDTDGWEQAIRERPDLAPALTKEAESQFRGVADGATNRTQRLKILGNGIVPQVAAAAWHLMMEYK